MSIGDWTQKDQMQSTFTAMNAQRMMNMKQNTTSSLTDVTSGLANMTMSGTTSPSISNTTFGYAAPTPVPIRMEPANGWRVVAWTRPASSDEPVTVRVRPIVGFVQSPYSSQMAYVWADGASLRQSDNPPAQLGAARVLTLVGPDEPEAMEAWRAEAQEVYERELAREAAERLVPEEPADAPQGANKAWAKAMMQAPMQATYTGTGVAALGLTTAQQATLAGLQGRLDTLTNRVK